MIQTSKKFRLFQFFVAAVLMLGCSISGLAQTTYGSVRGQAKDPQGAVVGGAMVTLTNQDTKIARTSMTGKSGDYNFTAVDPGNYKVSVAMTGFKTTENKDIVVTTGATSTVDLTLTLGGATETVEVTTSEPLIDTANANGGQTFSSQQLTELPNLGRNPFVFEKLDAAVTPVGDPRYVRAEDQTGQSTISVSGAPIGANNFAVDGIPISQSNGGVTFIPSLEAVSDVKVQANTYDAEVGRAGGGLFNTTLKSGTDTYHGVLYGMTRQTNWSANSFTNNRTPYLVNGVQVAAITPRADVTTYLYAGAFGGPIPYSKKVKYLDKTFFWIVEEGYRQAQPLPGSGSAITPTPAELTGDFTADYGGGTLALAKLYDPTTTTASGSRQPLQGLLNGVPSYNVIPTAYINPIGSFIAKAYPACTACSNAYGSNNYFGSDDFKTRSDMYSGKLDHVFTQWWSGAVSYVHLATQEPTGSFYHTVYNSDGILHRFNDATAFNNVFQVSPTMVVTAGYGFNRYYSHQVPYSYSAFPGGFNQATGFGGTGFNAAYVALVQSHTFPTITVAGVGPSGSSSLPSLGTSDSGPTIQSSRNVVIGLSKSLGKQDIKAGYVWRALSNFQQPLGSSGAFTFNGQYTTSNGKVISAASGNALADLLLGAPSAQSVSQVGSPSFNQQIGYHALFVQDDFRATQKLTVNVGLRYEYELGQKEANNKYVVGFDPTISYAFPCNAAAAGVASCATAHGGLVYAGKNGYPTHADGFSHAKFSPRIGLAYEPRPGTAVRGGFGMFYAPVATVTDTTGYSQTTNSVPIGNVVTPIAVGANAPLATPFGGASAVLAPSGNTLGALSGLGSSVSAQGFNRAYPVVEQYSVNVQQQLPGKLTVEIGYIGAHSLKFIQSVGVNQISDGLLAQYAAAGGVSTTTVANPYYTASLSNGTTTYPTTGALASTKIAPGQLALPFPQYVGGAGVTLLESVGYSHYNALEVKVQKRMKGLTLLSTYTWSSNWDNFYGAASAFSTSLNTNSNVTGAQDYTNLKGEYARAINNIPNRWTLAVTYGLPIGRGQRFFSNMPKLLDLFLGGYEVNTVSIMQNGSPMMFNQTDLTTSLSTVAGFGGAVQRPTLIGNPCLSGSPESRYNAYFNTAAFAATPGYTYSTLPRTYPCAGPGYANTDLSLNKTFNVKEKVKIQFRAEALNATNTPEFANPGLNFTTTQSSVTAAPSALTKSSTTGIIQGTVGFNRTIQLGGRISF